MSLRKLIGMAIALAVITGGLFVFTAGNNTDGLTVHIKENSTENSWTKNLRDRNWQVYLSPEIKNILDLGTTETPEQNPHAALYNSGVTPMVSTETGVAEGKATAAAGPIAAGSRDPYRDKCKTGALDPSLENKFGRKTQRRPVRSPYEKSP